MSLSIAQASTTDTFAIYPPPESNLSSQPALVLENIFSYLKKDEGNLALTCRKWLQVVRSNPRFKMICKSYHFKRKHGETHREAYARHIFLKQKYGSIKTISGTLSCGYGFWMDSC